MNPTSMTDFGIPFKADDNPVGFEIDYNYKAGAQMVQTEPYVGLMGIPAFRDPRKIPGKDMASIIVELHESTPGRFDYYKNYEKPSLPDTICIQTEHRDGGGNGLYLQKLRVKNTLA